MSTDNIQLFRIIKPQTDREELKFYNDLLENKLAGEFNFDKKITFTRHTQL